jgi:integrase
MKLIDLFQPGSVRTWEIDGDVPVQSVLCYDSDRVVESTRPGGSMARRRFQNGSVFSRGKRTKVWVGRWLEDEVNADGIIHRRHCSEVLGTFSELPTKRLALRRLQERLALVNSPVFKPKHKLTFREVAEKWKREVMQLHKPSSQSSFKGNLTSLVEFFGAMDLAEIDFSTVQRWISEQKCSAKTIRNRFGTFRLVMQYAKSCGFLQSFDFKGLRFPKRGLINQPCFTAAESKKIIEAAREPFRTMFWLVAETGMRGGEVCGLMVEDILDRAVFVRRSAWRGKLQTPKSPKAVRRVEISSALAEHLARHIGDRKTGLVFQTREGTAFDNYNVVSWDLKPLLKKLHIDRKGAGLHAFRHSNASALDSLGIPLSVRQDRLGHVDIAMTMNYSHAASADRRSAADRIGAVFAPSLPAPEATC